MKLSRWCRGDDAGAEQSHRIFDRKELARFSLQSNDRLHLTEGLAQGSVLVSGGFDLGAALEASRKC